MAMMKILKIVVLMVLIGTGGCFGTTRLYYSQASLANESPVKVKGRTSNWFWGLAKGKSAIMGAACGQNGVASIEVEHGAGDWLFYIFTLGLYARTTVTFTCQ